MKICITTGGSGGHIFPALSFADAIKHKHEITFIGNDHKMESWIIPKEGYEFFSIHNQGLQGSIFDKIKAILSQFKAIQQARVHLENIRPDLVISFGGYVSLPVVMAAQKLNIKIILHEQNALPGKANRMAAKYATKIVTCYEETFAGDPKTAYLGNPRASLTLSDIDSSAELARLNLDLNKRLVLMVMGSQGSTSMNHIFKEFIKEFKSDDYQVVIVTGPSNYELFMNDMNDYHHNIKITDFVDQKALLPYIDLMVCRSGASTIAEIQAFGLAACFIPSPHVANNHQYYNALALHDKDACFMLEEAKINGLKLNKALHDMMANEEKLKTLSVNAKSMNKPNAIKDMLELAEETVSLS